MKHFLTKPGLTEALSVVLPTVEQTWLLRACLWSGNPGERAWTTWSKSIGDPVDFLRRDQDGVKGLLPLLFHSLRAKGVVVEKTFWTYLRTAYLRDELRSRSYSQICRSVMSALDRAKIPAILLKGAALAETAYENPALQHAHYLDILVKDVDLPRSVSLLPSLGFAHWDDGAYPAFERIEILHESKLPLRLYRRLFQTPFYNVQIADVWTRSRLGIFDAVPTRVLSPEDNLLHVCGSAFEIERHESLRWICDSWFLLNQNPNFDWDMLLDSAARNRLALPLSVTIGYLAECLNAPIPVEYLDRIYSAASRSPKIGRDAAVFAARSRPTGSLRQIVYRTRNWRVRFLILKSILLPSPKYLRWHLKIRASWKLPLYYFLRPLRYLNKRIRSNLKAQIRHLVAQKNVDRTEPDSLS